MATWNSDGSLSSVQTLHNSSAVDGDTITIPSGTFTWTGMFSMTKNIVLKGASMLDGGTLIQGSGLNGRFIDVASNDSVHTAIVRDIQFKVDNSVSRNSGIMRLHGTARVRLNGSTWEGGVRVTSVRFSCTTETSGFPYPVAINDWITGVIDHCWWDYPSGQNSAGVLDGNHSSAPGYVTSSTAVNDAGKIYRPQYGQNSFSRPYVWGGGPGTNGDYDALYIEDCLICKSKNLGIASADGSFTGTGQGGSRMVVRHNSCWCITSGHGFSETGNNSGIFIYEIYNNFYKAPLTTTAVVHNVRSGAEVCFNERREGPFGNPTVTMVPTFNRLTAKGAAGAMVGPGDGTNFFDLNSRRDPLELGALGVINESSPLFTFPAETTPSDTRIGCTYGHGNSTVTNSGTSIDLINYEIGALANKFVGLTLRNIDTSGAASLGGQYNNGTTISCAIVTASAAATGSGTVTLTITPGPDGNFIIGPTQNWEFRYVEKLLGGPGGTLIPTMNGGDVGNNATHGFPAFLTSKLVDTGSGPVPVFQYWCEQQEDGLWEWDVQHRTNSGSSWVDCDSGTSWNTRLVLGGIHNDVVRTIANGANANYPTQTNTVDSLRVGANPIFWSTIGVSAFGGPISIESTDPGAITQAYGAVYPHPLVTPPASQKIIFLTGEGMDFGNVIIGESPTATVTCTNTGDTLLTVDSVSSNNAKFVLSSTAGFTVAPNGEASHDITLTYTPTTETTDNVTITFDSDADSGLETITGSGTGVPPAGGGGGGKGKGHKKGVLVQRGR